MSSPSCFTNNDTALGKAHESTPFPEESDAKSERVSYSAPLEYSHEASELDVGIYNGETLKVRRNIFSWVAAVA